MVKYKNKLHPWKYVVVLPVGRNPIKISSPNLSQLKPVHEGIRRVLTARQRNRENQGGGQGGHHPGPNTAGPVRQADPYGRNGAGGGEGGHRPASHGGDGGRGGGGGGHDPYDHRGGVGSTRRRQEQ